MSKQTSKTPTLPVLFYLCSFMSYEPIFLQITQFQVNINFIKQTGYVLLFYNAQTKALVSIEHIKLTCLQMVL